MALEARVEPAGIPSCSAFLCYCSISAVLLLCAIRCLLPLGGGRFMHLVVLCGSQGADSDAEQLALTEQLFDAALGELGVVDSLV